MCLVTCLTSLNPFQANVPILYPLKKPENQRFSGVFRGYNKMGTLAWNGLTGKPTKMLEKAKHVENTLPRSINA